MKPITLEESPIPCIKCGSKRIVKLGDTRVPPLIWLKYAKCGNAGAGAPTLKLAVHIWNVLNGEK